MLKHVRHLLLGRHIFCPTNLHVPILTLSHWIQATTMLNHSWVVTTATVPASVSVRCSCRHAQMRRHAPPPSACPSSCHCRCHGAPNQTHPPSSTAPAAHTHTQSARHSVKRSKESIISVTHSVSHAVVQRSEQKALGQ